jgi:hypothetical protein
MSVPGGGMSAGVVIANRQALTRRGDVLRVTVGLRHPGQPTFPSLDTLWLTVDVPKRLLGNPLPRRVVVAESRFARHGPGF